MGADDGGVGVGVDDGVGEGVGAGAGVGVTDEEEEEDAAPPPPLPSPPPHPASMARPGIRRIVGNRRMDCRSVLKDSRMPGVVVNCRTPRQASLPSRD